jgi:hypothetical protein
MWFGVPLAWPGVAREPRGDGARRGRRWPFARAGRCRAAAKSRLADHTAKNAGILVLLAQGDAGGREEVIEKDQQDGVDEAGALAAAPRGHAQGNADQHEHQAGCGIGKAVVQLDEESLGSGP